MTQTHFVLSYGAVPWAPPGTCGDVLDEAYYGRPACQLPSGHAEPHSCPFTPIRHGIGWERNYLHTLTVEWERGEMFGRPFLHIMPTSGSWWEPMAKVKPRGKRRLRAVPA